MEKKWYLGMDIGGTKCAASIGYLDDSGLTVVEKAKFPTPAHSPYEALDQLAETAKALAVKHDITLEQIQRIGVSCGSPLDAKQGIVLSPPNLLGWDAIPVTDYFRQKLGVPAKLENDANACAVVEWKMGAGQGCNSMIFLTFGTGFGAGLILDGRLYGGRDDMAGEIGHVRLTKDGPEGYRKKGSCEGYCSGGGIAKMGVIAVEKALASGKTPRLLEKAGSLDGINAKLIADLADEGDEFCRAIYRESGEKLGYAVSILMDLLNPERIVIGSIYLRSRNLLEDAMNTVIEREVLPYNRCPVVPAGVGEAVGDYAALAIAAWC